ncbi:MAG: SAM-dependent chlorinase/fluorinase [Candidatus Hydrogenedentes bacterium]|nr:SAM-dependent chlorinase/fluorinase [Candidatus Hydrogenedentota bacterium]
MDSQLAPIITLTTDFGLRDPYVAAVKGVILTIAPQAQVIDLSHEIAPQSVVEGALFLAGALRYFPRGAVHMAVVDPGVGTNRNPIAVSAGGQTIVCPDNGLPTLFLREFPLQEARIISNPALIRQSLSATFHARDIFAPAAAHIAMGTPMAELGDEIDTIVALDIPKPQKSDKLVTGEILHEDRFGNLITNIHSSLLGRQTPSLIRVKNHRFTGVHRTYAEAPPCSPLVLFGSSGYLEIAVNGANASAALGLNKGDQVIVELA